MSSSARSVDLPPTACPDWAIRLSRGEMPMSLERLPVATEEAERWSKIFKRLRVTDIEGKPRVANLPNHVAFDNAGRALWGGPAIRELLLSTPKKQSKTSFSSLMFFAGFLAEKTPRQPFTIAAPTREVAAYSFDMVAGAIEADDTLKRIMHVRSYVREIEHRRTGGRFKISAFSKGAMTGLKGNILLDETAVLGSHHAAQGLRAQIKGALAANKKAKALYVSTTDENPPQGMWLQVINYCRMIRDGKLIDETVLPVIYEPPKDVDPWSDPSWWPRLLPSHGFTTTDQFLNSVIAEAEASGPSAVQRDKAQFFNVEAGAWLGGIGGWLLTELYPEMSRPMTLDEVVARSQTLSVGIDLGGLDDLGSLSVLGNAGGKVLIWTHAWAMQSAWDRNIDCRAKFDDFVTDGDLERVKTGEDIAAMLEICRRLERTAKLKAVGLDPHGAKQLVDALTEAGNFVLQDEEDQYPPGMVPVVGVGQSALAMNSPRATIEREAAAGNVEIAESGMMSWALGNVILQQRGAAVGIARDIQGAKIDPVASLLDAVAVDMAVLDPSTFDVGALIA